MHTWFHVQLDQKILDGIYYDPSQINAYAFFFPFAECEDRDDQEIYTETAAAIN